jgi:hypothetical protein
VVNVDFYVFMAGLLLRLVVALLLVDMDLFAKLRLRAGAVFKDAYVLGVGFVALSRLDGEGFLVFFPAVRKLCLCFYLDLCGLFDSVSIAGRLDGTARLAGVQDAILGFWDCSQRR